MPEKGIERFQLGLGSHVPTHNELFSCIVRATCSLQCTSKVDRARFELAENVNLQAR